MMNAAPPTDAKAPVPPPPKEDLRTKVPRWLIRAIAVYTAIAIPIIVLAVMVGSHDPAAKAIILMGLGLVVIWCLGCGSIMLRYAENFRGWIARWNLRWEWKFVGGATVFALAEEVVTTSLTNVVPPFFGVTSAQAHITASSNYLIVICFSSVVVFVPEFVGWVLLLRRVTFTPNEVFLLYGFLGTTMEASINPTALFAGFWFFVYGLMVYLPAYALPTRPNAVRPRWWHYVLSYIVPLACALPVVAADTLLARALGITLWH